MRVAPAVGRSGREARSLRPYGDRQDIGAAAEGRYQDRQGSGDTGRGRRRRGHGGMDWSGRAAEITAARSMRSSTEILQIRSSTVAGDW